MGTFRRAIIERARESINGVSIRNIRPSSGLKSLLNHTLWVNIKPLPCIFKTGFESVEKRENDDDLWVEIGVYNLTEDDGDFSVGLLEGIGVVAAGEDDDGAVKGGSEPGQVGVPEERPSLAGDGEIVSVGVAGLDGALGHVGRAVGPPGAELPDAVPVDGHVLRHVVHDLDQNSVAFPRHQWRTR